MRGYVQGEILNAGVDRGYSGVVIPCSRFFGRRLDPVSCAALLTPILRVSLA